MASPDVQMDIPVVEDMANKFKSTSDVLKGVSKALQIAIMILKMTAFVGLVGGLAVERFLSWLKPQVDEMAEKLEELHYDLYGAIISFRDGDNSGSQRFA